MAGAMKQRKGGRAKTPTRAAAEPKSMKGSVSSAAASTKGEPSVYDTFSLSNLLASRPVPNYLVGTSKEELDLAARLGVSGKVSKLAFFTKYLALGFLFSFVIPHLIIDNQRVPVWAGHGSLLQLGDTLVKHVPGCREVKEAYYGKPPPPKLEDVLDEKVFERRKIKSKFAGYTPDDMVSWSSNAILGRGSDAGPPNITAAHLGWEFLAFALMCFVIHLSDTKPFPFIRKFKIDGKVLPSNDFEVQNGPLGKHIYLTAHAMYMQFCHQLCSFTLAVVLYFSDPPHTPLLGLCTFLLRVTNFASSLVCVCSLGVALLYVGLVKNSSPHQGDSYYLWKKFGFALYEIDLCAHCLLIPVALLDLMLLRPFYYQNVYVLYSLQDSFNFHTLLNWLYVLYYFALILVNFKVTGNLPYDFLYSIEKKGWVRGWVPFTLVIGCSLWCLVFLMTFAMPEHLHVFAF